MREVELTACPPRVQRIGPGRQSRHTGARSSRGRRRWSDRDESVGDRFASMSEIRRTSISRCVFIQSRAGSYIKASLAALAAGAALTRPPHFTRRHLSKRRGSRRGEHQMTEQALTPQLHGDNRATTRGSTSRSSPPHPPSSTRRDRHAARGDVRRRRRLRRRTHSRSTALADDAGATWSSSMRWSWPGNAPSTAAISICCCPRIRCSSASTRCSTGSGNAFRRPGEPGCA